MLILTSSDFANEKSKEQIIRNLPGDIKDCRILYFVNENFTRENLEKRAYRDRLKKCGFAKKNIYVFNYDNPEEFDYPELDCIFIGGGNTFKTLQKLRETGADKIIKDYVLNKGVTYIGGSAGAHIACKSIEHIKQFDECPDDFSDFSGLGFFDGILICHYSSAREPYAKKAREEGKFKVFTLKDDEILVTD